MREYLYIEQLAELTPWTPDAIQKMVNRGVLRKGEHWFQLASGGRMLFKWRAIVGLIERHEPKAETESHGESQTIQSINVEQAEKRLQGLLG